MTEPVIPRPADHAFVLQLQENHGRPETCRAGRVEHLSSGQATTFTTTAELWTFVDTVLTELARKARVLPLPYGRATKWRAKRKLRKTRNEK